LALLFFCPPSITHAAPRRSVAATQMPHATAAMPSARLSPIGSPTIAPARSAQQVPTPVDHEGRVRLLLLQHVVERAHHLRKFGRAQRAFPPRRRARVATDRDGRATIAGAGRRHGARTWAVLCCSFRYLATAPVENTRPGPPSREPKPGGRVEWPPSQEVDYVDFHMCHDHRDGNSVLRSRNAHAAEG
jgi:hypothetical protein